MAANRATYGVGQYGSASYGENPVTVKAPLSVSKTGAIYGSATYGTNTYGGSITETHSGIAATGSVTTVTVTADSSFTLPSVSATGSVTTVTVTADSSVTLPSVSATGSVTTVTVSADGVGNVNVGTAATNNLSPEFGLTLDHVFSEADMSGTTISNGGLNNDYNGNFPGTNQNTVLAFETTLPSSFSASFDGFLTLGGTGAGTWAGVYNDSGTYKYWVSAGEGATGTGFGSLGDAAADEEAISNIPEFDGGTHTVVIEIRINPGRIRSFIDGRLVLEGNTTGGGALETSIYAGSHREAFGSWGPVRDVSGTGDWSGTIQSDLRVYTGELADFGTTLTFTGDSTLTTPSVSATATPDADLVIEADARHTVTSVRGVSGVTSVGIVGVAIHEVSGVTGVGRVTSSTVSGDSNLTVASVSSTSQISTASVTGDSDVSVTGVTATATAGDVIAKTGRVVVVGSVEATGAVNTGANIISGVANFVLPDTTATGTVNDSLTFVAGANLTLASVQATGTIDDLTLVAEANTTPPSVQATATADPDVVIEGDALHVITSVQGVTATGGIGAVVAGANIDTLTGVQATGQVATATTSGSANTTPESAQGTGQTSTVTISGGANFALSSVEATTGVSTVSIALPRVVTPAGVSSTTSVQTVSISASGSVALPSVSTTATADPDVVIEADALHTITSVQGVSATGGVGDVVAEANISTITGVEATGSVTTASVVIGKTVVSPSVSATATADPDVVITGDAVHVITSVQGVSATGGVGSVTADANVTTVTGVEATGSVTAVEIAAKVQLTASAFGLTGSVAEPTISVQVNIFDANNRNEKRTVYISADKPRVAFVGADSRRIVDIPADKPRTTYVRAA